MEKLTRMEKMVLNAMRDNDYNDALEYNTWLFCATEYSGLDTKQARGALSSLIKKDLVTVYEDDNRKFGGSDDSSIGFTEKGRALFDNADGEECSWGGPRLLKIEEEEQMSLTFEDIMDVIEEVKKEEKEKEAKAEKKSKKQTKKAEKLETVKVVAFTGMELGEFKVVKQTKKEVTVLTKAGKELVFDLKTGYQTNAKKEAFRNRIVVG